MTDNILVVGGVGGIEICHRYANAGCKVHILDIDTEAAIAACEEINTTTTKAYYYTTDIRDSRSVDETVARIGRSHKHISHIIFVAGGASQEDWSGIEHASDASILDSTRLNLLSHQFVLRASKPLLIAAPSKNKSIVLIGTINIMGAWQLPVYTAAKAGLVGLMNGLAYEFTKEHGIRINMITLGTMAGPRARIEPKDYALLKDHMLLDSFPNKTEAADAAHMLTHVLKHCTHQQLIIDSGQSVYAPDFNTISKREQ